VSGPTVRTRRLDRDVDLLAVAGPDGVLWERGGFGLAGRGIALRIPIDEMSAALERFEVDDEVNAPGCGPVAFAALPFHPEAPTTAVVPEVVVGRAEDGTRWMTVVDGREQAPEARDIGATRPSASPALRLVAGASLAARWAPGPSRFRVESSRSPGEWCDLVAMAAKYIASGTTALRKVVLAREVVVTAEADLDVTAIVDRLRLGYPGCYVFCVDGFVGASPELLVSRLGDVVRSHPMAGTAPRGGDPAADARIAARLLASTKNREEHQITIDMVHDTLLPWCSYVDYEAEPSVVAVANVQHLATLVEGRLSEPAPSVLELVAALHPTPAVCGDPRDEARAFIDTHEGLDRRRYTGTVGWVDARGNGSWAVSVRCAEIDGSVARVCVGNGIVADSDPAVELAETRLKLQAVLGAIIRP
jgi:menaquinone-specific isochorismate synthase